MDPKQEYILKLRTPPTQALFGEIILNKLFPTPQPKRSQRPDAGSATLDLSPSAQPKRSQRPEAGSAALDLSPSAQPSAQPKRSQYFSVFPYAWACISVHFGP